MFFVMLGVMFLGFFVMLVLVIIVYRREGVQD
jgi:hypothetical protein